MNITFFSLIVFVFYLVYTYIKNKLWFFVDNEIPHLPTVPMLGNMATVYFNKKHVMAVINDVYNFSPKASPKAKYLGAYQLLKNKIK